MAPLSRPLRVAVSTPYYRETDDVLRTCLESVRDQTHADCRHFVVSDGHPNPLVDTFDVAHIRLPDAHGDNGDFARCIGALAAIAEGFDAVAFLDADNWYRPDHISRMVALQARTGVALCTSGRSIHSLDGTLLIAQDEQCDGVNFTDTSCYCFFQAAFDLLQLWGALAKVAGPIGDRLLWSAVQLRGISRAHDASASLAFRSQYAHHYTQLGMTPPPGAKTGPDLAKAWGEFWAIPYQERIGMLLGFGGAEAVRLSQRAPSAQSIRPYTVSLRGSSRSLTLQMPDDASQIEPDVLELEKFRSMAKIPPPRAILDIGASIGIAAAYLRLLFPDAAITCIEPEPKHFDLLARNAAVIGNCSPFQIALTLGSRSHPYFIAAIGDPDPSAENSRTAARSLAIDADRFIQNLKRQAFELIRIGAGGAAMPILLSLRSRIPRTAVLLVDYRSDADRRMIDALLSDTHVLWHGNSSAPGRGTLCYRLRSRLHRGSAEAAPPES